MKIKLLNMNITYENKLYRKGDTVDVDDNTAKYLLENKHGIEVKATNGLDKIKKTANPDYPNNEFTKKVLEEKAIPELKELASELGIELKATKKAEIVEEILATKENNEF